MMAEQVVLSRGCGDWRFACGNRLVFGPVRGAVFWYVENGRTVARCVLRAMHVLHLRLWVGSIGRKE